MTDLSQRIRDYLYNHPHVSMTDLERAMGVQARGLQSEGNEAGPFRVAVKEIYRETGWFVFSRSGKGGGVTMTRDREQARQAAQRLLDQVYHTRDLAEAMMGNVQQDERREAAEKAEREAFTLTP